MSQVTVPDDTYERVAAFKPVVEAILEESLENDDYFELLLNLAPNYILREILGSTDALTLLESLQQRGQKHPVQVYGYIAETMQRGQQVLVEAERLAEARQRIGFLRSQR